VDAGARRRSRRRRDPRHRHDREREAGRQAAPPLKLKRVDGQPGEIDLGAYAGKRVLIDSSPPGASPARAWRRGSPGGGQAAPAGLVTIGVTLAPRTRSRTCAWIAKHGIAYPIIGEGLGWDGETDDAWHVDGIPALIMVGPDDGSWPTSWSEPAPTRPPATSRPRSPASAPMRPPRGPRCPGQAGQARRQAIRIRAMSASRRGGVLKALLVLIVVGALGAMTWVTIANWRKDGEFSLRLLDPEWWTLSRPAPGSPQGLRDAGSASPRPSPTRPSAWRATPRTAVGPGRG